MSKLTTGQIGQLIEIDRVGNGIGKQVQELIVRLTSGGVNQRRIQAKRLWDRGFGSDPKVNAKTFKHYLAGIPEIPASLLADDADLPLLSLCDPRPGLLQSCKLLGIQHEELGYKDDSAEPFDQNFPLPTEPFWFRHDDGRANRERRPDECRDELTGDIQAGSAMEGVFAYAHHPTIVVEGEHILDLPRTVHRSGRVFCAYLGVWHGQVKFLLDRSSDIAYPYCGAFRLRRK